MAIDDANGLNIVIDGKKIKFELDAQDDQADPKQGTIVAQKLVDDKVAGVVGHLNSGHLDPRLQDLQRRGPSDGLALGDQSQADAAGLQDHVPRDGERRRSKAASSARRLSRAWAARRSPSSTTRPRTARGSPTRPRKLPRPPARPIVAREYTNDKATDFKAILTKIKAKSPDVIMYGGMDAQGGPMVKQMKELGIKAKYIAGDGVCSAEWPKLAGGAAEGQYCTQAGLAAGQDGESGRLRDAVHGQVRPDPGLRAVFVRRSKHTDLGDAEGQLDRSGEVPARARHARTTTASPRRSSSTSTATPRTAPSRCIRSRTGS